MDITELIGRAVSGDKRAVFGLYDAYKNELYYLCNKLVGNNGDAAAGMLQSTFMHVFGKLRLLKNPDTFGAWSYTTAAKRCRSYLSGTGAPVDFSSVSSKLAEDAGSDKRFPYGAAGSGSALLADEQACAAVEAAVDRLPAPERFAVLMFFFCRLDPEQIARNMQTSPENIRKCIISGAGIIGSEIKGRISEIPSLSEYGGAAELGDILRARAKGLEVPDRISDTIVATGMSLVSSFPDSSQENQDYTYEDERTSDSGSGNRTVGVIIMLLLLLLIGAVAIFAVKILPGIAGGNKPVNTDTSDGTAAVGTVSDEPDTSGEPTDGSSENTVGDTDAVTVPETVRETVAVTEPVTTAPNDTPVPVGKDYTYVRENDGSVTITKYNGTDERVAIPSTIDGAPVSAVGESAFRENKTVKKVVIPDGVRYIGTYAFLNCSSLEEVTVPSSVKSVGLTVLGGTKWLESRTEEFVTIGDGVLIKINSKSRDITVPDGIKYISNVFYYIGTVENITIPSSVWGIGELAFTVCIRLNTINIPASVTSIHDGAIYQCDALSAINAPSGSTAAKWCSDHGFGTVLKNQ